MSFELPTESPIGVYDRNAFFLVTFPDATQKLYSRSCKSSHGQISPLSWWKKCGIFTDERDLWVKSVMYPEHAQVMKRAGIAPSDLFNTLLSPSQVEDVLQWFNVYRAVHGRNPKSLHEFSDFVANVESCSGYRTKNPVALGRFVAKLQSYRLDYSTFIFTIGNDNWIEAICSHLDSAPDNSYLAPLVKSLMQVGASSESVDVLVHPGKLNTREYGKHAVNALKAMFNAGEFKATVASYAETRLLAESLCGAPYSADCIKELFFAPGTDRQRLRDVVLEDKVTDEFRLTAIFTEEVPTALVGGFL